MRILLIESIEGLAEFFMKAMKDAGFAVSHVQHGEEAKAALADMHFDALVFDLAAANLPANEQAEAIQALRRFAYKTPILVMGSQSNDMIAPEIVQNVEGFLKKPFSMEELVIRLKNILPPVQETGPIGFGGLELDTRFAHLKSNGKILPLTRKEAALLEALMRRPNTIVDRTIIEQALYGGEHEVGPNALEVLVSRLRKKLMAGNVDVQLLTVRGAGYMLMNAK